MVPGFDIASEYPNGVSNQEPFSSALAGKIDFFSWKKHAELSPCMLINIPVTSF